MGWAPSMGLARSSCLLLVLLIVQWLTDAMMKTASVRSRLTVTDTVDARHMFPSSCRLRPVRCFVVHGFSIVVELLQFRSSKIKFEQYFCA